MRTERLSRKEPDHKLEADDVEIEAGLPKDRLKGYLEGRKMSGLSRDERANANFTGADARAALVGRWKKGKKGFRVHNSPKRTYGSSGY